MSSPDLPAAVDPIAMDDTRFDNLQRTYNFRHGGFAAWSRATLAVIGAGLLGSRLVEEAVVSGASVCIFEPDIGAITNLGNQRCQVGVPKALALAERCAAIRPGCARGFVCDVRQAGVRLLLACDVWFDCTDDPSLAWPLTELSNGLARPLLRCAVDGSGQTELGRVLCSHGGAGHACQVCAYSVADLFRRSHRTPCPHVQTAVRPPTLAGGPIGAGTAGLALPLGQRLITGMDATSVLDHECLLDWTNFQLLHLQLTRSENCLSGHQAWQWLDTDVNVQQGTLRDLFHTAQQELATSSLALAVHLLPFNVQAYCPCGNVRVVVGTACANTPTCNACGQTMSWLEETRIASVRLEQAYELGILDLPLAALGVPAGAMVVATNSHQPALRMLLPLEN